MKVVWTTEALDDLGRRDRYSRAAILEQFSVLAAKAADPAGFGAAIESTPYFWLPLFDGRYFIIFEFWMFQEKKVRVVAVARRPIKTSEELEEFFSKRHC